MIRHYNYKTMRNLHVFLSGMLSNYRGSVWRSSYPVCRQTHEHMKRYI